MAICTTCVPRVLLFSHKQKRYINAMGWTSFSTITTKILQQSVGREPTLYDMLFICSLNTGLVPEFDHFHACRGLSYCQPQILTRHSAKYKNAYVIGKVFFCHQLFWVMFSKSYAIFYEAVEISWEPVVLF